MNTGVVAEYDAKLTCQGPGLALYHSRENVINAPKEHGLSILIRLIPVLLLVVVVQGCAFKGHIRTGDYRADARLHYEEGVKELSNRDFEDARFYF